MGSQALAPQELTQDAETAHDSKRRGRGQQKLAPGSVATAASPPEDNLIAAQSDWWQPQPRATLEPNDYQDRPHAPLAACLSCALCHQLLQEAIASLECGHTYCYDCIESRVEIGGNHNVCPVAGCGIVLGPSPFDHHRLVYDSLLDSLVQKIFPRPELDVALTARRSEREEATRLARAEVNGCNGRGRQHQHQHEEDEQKQQQQFTMEQDQQQQQGQEHISSSPAGVVAAGRRRRGGGSGGISRGGAESDDERSGFTGSDPESLQHPTGRTAAAVVTTAVEAGARGEPRRHR